ncbi:MAG: chemotaxis protein [Hydrogenophilales bacterium CG17_big_fil_post_rev_8_21_14_2_50_63_12]|nr:MAG: chemotaxis protein [Hydrogenophilales bacterium CG17_big_fil_post_rev_8_21_14_2_50_63_12]PIX96114.1 MAG: chemotaxis protein [Hydrogenophilales bacterium CG_4_10_14_3_um_filter_63_21]PJB04624.1 MAG: chemotaxis protein [Hydrogenophilales bacterium CG_4_9_14_3_um_filter_63_34]
MAMNKPQRDIAKIFGNLGNRLGPRVATLMNRWMALDPSRLPLLGKLPAEQRLPAVVVVLLGSLLLATLLMIWYTVQVGNRAQYVEISTRLQMLSQRYSKTAQQAVLGNKAAFRQLDESRQAFADGLVTLIDGGAGIPSSPGSMQGELGELKKRWEVSKKDIQALVTQQDTLVTLGRSLAEINQRNSELLDLAEQVIALLPAESKKQLAFANQQALWTQRMAKNANALLSSDQINPETAYQLGQDVRSFREVLRGLIDGGGAIGIVAVSDADARERLLELRDVFNAFEKQVDSILKNMPQLVEAKRAGRELFDESEKLLALTQQITARYQAMGAGISLFLAVVFALIALAALLVLGVLNVGEARRHAEEAAQENQRNQEAILRLLNEMGDLADGDLTVQATVTENITGAIADSVNYAIEELRLLVQGINRASEQVTQAASEARASSDELLAAAERQSRQITETSEAVSQMSASIVQVSRNAADSTRVAEQSLATARKGGDSVRSAIVGMESIRNHIQETSKRIKRLGESSQEIGGIVDLISDITEQTNVLALNAAIQAAAAGEAGRGFTVVAEEVQRLAERSAQATRRIGAIVKTIQSDTQDAVNAMENSTQGVVEGTVLSDAAGHSLAEIESVSDDLAHLIQRISDATQAQTGTAQQIADSMREILAVTGQASEGARRSAASIGQLSLLSDELKVSVSGFKL